MPTLKRLRCPDCREVFSQRSVQQERCTPCGAAFTKVNRKRVREHIRTLERARRGQKVVDPVLRLSEVRAWLVEALEPHYGKPELSPILSSILGKFGVRKDRAA